RRHTRSKRDWSSDVCSSDLQLGTPDCGAVDTGQRTPPGAAVAGERARTTHARRYTPRRVDHELGRAVRTTGPGAVAARTQPAARSEERRVGKDGRARGRAGG